MVSWRVAARGAWLKCPPFWGGLRPTYLGHFLPTFPFSSFPLDLSLSQFSIQSNTIMGNESSQLQTPEDEFAEFDGIETLGYRVLGVQPNSPASAAGLVSFLDFLVGCNGVMLMGSGEGLEEGDEYDDVDFPQLLRENEGKELELREFFSS